MSRNTARRNKNQKVPLEEKIQSQISALLSTDNPTPGQIYDLMFLGHMMYRQGLGLPHSTIWQAIVDAFREHDQHYLNPYQLAALKDESTPGPEDFVHCYEPNENR